MNATGPKGDTGSHAPKCQVPDKGAGSNPENFLSNFCKFTVLMSANIIALTVVCVFVSILLFQLLLRSCTLNKDPVFTGLMRQHALSL